MTDQKPESARPSLSRTPTLANGFPTSPASASLLAKGKTPTDNANAVIELSDGSAFQGISFGAPGVSVSGECVFQTGERAFQLRT